MRLSTISPTGTRRRRMPMSLANATGASAIFARSHTPKKLAIINTSTTPMTAAMPTRMRAKRFIGSSFGGKAYALALIRLHLFSNNNPQPLFANHDDWLITCNEIALRHDVHLHAVDECGARGAQRCERAPLRSEQLGGSRPLSDGFRM